jgi:hypothetical protein
VVEQSLVWVSGCEGAVLGWWKKEIHLEQILGSHLALDQVRAQAGVNAHGHPLLVELPGRLGPFEADAIGNVLWVSGIVFVIGGETFLVPMHPAGIEQEEGRVVGSQLWILGQLQEKGQPVVAGRFPSNVHPRQIVLGQRFQQQRLGLLKARQAVGKRAMAFDRLTIRPQQGDVRPLLTEINSYQ